MMSMPNLVAIAVETLRIDSGCSLEKFFNELIRMNPWMALNLSTIHIDSRHGCLCGPLT